MNTVARPSESKTTGFAFSTSPTAVVYVAWGVEVPVIYVFSNPPFSGLPLPSKNCNFAYGAGVKIWARVVDMEKEIENKMARVMMNFFVIVYFSFVTALVT